MRRGFSINFFGCIMRMLSKFMERAYLCLTSAYVIGTYAYSTVTRTKAAMSNRFSLGPTANNFPQFSFSYCLFFFLYYRILHIKLASEEKLLKIHSSKRTENHDHARSFDKNFLPTLHTPILQGRARLDDVSSSATDATIIIYGSTQPRSPYSPPLSRVTNTVARMWIRFVVGRWRPREGPHLGLFFQQHFSFKVSSEFHIVVSVRGELKSYTRFTSFS